MISFTRMMQTDAHYLRSQLLCHTKQVLSYLFALQNQLQEPTIDANIPIDANILLILLYGRAFCINRPLHIQPTVEFNGKIFQMGQFCINQKHLSNELFLLGS